MVAKWDRGKRFQGNEGKAKSMEFHNRCTIEFQGEEKQKTLLDFWLGCFPKKIRTEGKK